MTARMPLALLALAWELSGTAWAYPVYRHYLSSTYGVTGRCRVCHVADGHTERSSFGNDWQNAGETAAALQAVESRDSDGDGVKNGDEIRGGSNPGDRRSTPANVGREFKRAKEIAVPFDEIRLALAGARRVEAEDPRMSDEETRTIEAAVGRPLRPEERLPTFFVGFKGKRPTVVALFIHLTRPEGRFTVLAGINLTGKVERLFLFRADEDESSPYLRYLECLVGGTRTALPPPGPRSCPSDPQRQAVFEELATAVRVALWTVHTVSARSP
jgi:hypothetical protein